MKAANTAQDGTSALPYTPEHAFTLWSQYQATDAIAVGAGARYTSAACIAAATVRSARLPIPKATGWLMPKSAIALTVIVDLQLNVYNLFDTDYVASINKSGYRYHPGEPRTFVLTANMHF